MNKLVTIFFFIITVNSVKAQYTGGDNDGYSDQTLTQSTCSDLTPNFVYYGGNNDGYSDGTLTQSTCPDLTPNFAYYGGNEDGYSDGTLTQSICPDLTPNFSYYGGINDGHGDGNLTQSICPDLTPNFSYYGGINDGHGDGNLTQSICPDLTPNFSYYGGINDGFGWHYTQPIICTTPLPIELLEFLGICEGAVIKLNWSTASEINNDYFTIERSFDGVNFNILGTVAGAGNSIQTLHYTFVDENSMDGIYYYRLKQTDFNGTFKYSKLIDVACNSDFSQDIMVYPNPANEIINVISSNKISSIQVINDLGEHIMEINNLNGNKKCAINLSALLPGHYILIINTYYGIFFKSMVKI